MTPYLPYAKLWAALVLLAFVLLMINQFWTPITKGLYWVVIWVAYAFFSVYFWIRKRIKGIIEFFRGVVDFIRIIRAENEAEYEPHDPYIQMRRKQL